MRKLLPLMGLMVLGLAGGSSAWAGCSKDCQAKCEAKGGKDHHCDKKECDHKDGKCNHEKCDDAHCDHEKKK